MKRMMLLIGTLAALAYAFVLRGQAPGATTIAGV